MPSQAAVSDPHPPDAGSSNPCGGTRNAREGELVDLYVGHGLSQLGQGTLFQHAKDIQCQQGQDMT